MDNLLNTPYSIMPGGQVYPSSLNTSYDNPPSGGAAPVVTDSKQIGTAANNINSGLNTLSASQLDATQFAARAGVSPSQVIQNPNGPGFIVGPAGGAGPAPGAGGTAGQTNYTGPTGYSEMLQIMKPKGIDDFRASQTGSTGPGGNLGGYIPNKGFSTPNGFWEPITGQTVPEYVIDQGNGQFYNQA